MCRSRYRRWSGDYFVQFDLQEEDNFLFQMYIQYGTYRGKEL